VPPGSKIPTRRNTRLPAWDYRHPGPYAITICAEHRWHMFGAGENGAIILNHAGQMVETVWQEMPTEFPGVTLGAFVVMPNHLHAILWLLGGDSTSGPMLGTVVQRFKTITTIRYAAEVNAGRWASFDGRLWQRNFYDHIIRNDADLVRCERYIRANPANWVTDIDRDPDRPGGPAINLVSATASLTGRNPS
jgi:putative transposase